MQFIFFVEAVYTYTTDSSSNHIDTDCHYCLTVNSALPEAAKKTDMRLKYGFLIFPAVPNPSAAWEPTQWDSP